MATVPPSTLQLSTQLFSTPLAPLHHPTRPTSFSPRATNDDSGAAKATEPSTPPNPDDFEDRVSKIRLKYRSGQGKKAELRKARKAKKISSAGNVFLPPVPLKEPVSGGLKVDFGFSSYAERMNGRIAILGLSALLLVELATGKSVIKYHSPAIVFIQVYFVAAATAMYVKYEKEKISVWPQ